MEIDIPPFPENWTPLEHVVISNENGELRIAHDATDGLNTWEAIGMCIACADKLRRLLNDLTDEDPG
jgi:hypothetical protein